jgi:hypothetical protein
MDDDWRNVEEFPEYQVNRSGLVRNEDTGRVLSQSYNPQGAKKVGLFDGTRQHTRSVKFLVASAFVEGRCALFDTAVNLDGDQTNNQADNLIWRPRWFAMQYSKQFKEIGDWYLYRKVEDVDTERVYDDIVDAAITNGLLLRQILLSIHNNSDEAWPTRQSFRFCE